MPRKRDFIIAFPSLKISRVRQSSRNLNSNKLAFMIPLKLSTKGKRFSASSSKLILTSIPLFGSSAVYDYIEMIIFELSIYYLFLID